MFAKKAPKLNLEHKGGSYRAKDKILAIRVDGAIVGEKGQRGPAQMLGMSTVSGYEIQQLLERAADDDSVRAVMMQFNTPGGSMVGARAIYDGIKYFRKQKPILSHVEEMSASGGVYAMVGAKTIFADYGAITDSIGVTMGTRHWYDQPTSMLPSAFNGGVDTIGGIQSYALISAKGKDILSPWRRPDVEEIDTLQRLIDDSANHFVEHVAKARGIAPEVIRDEMCAYVFGNVEAIRFGLIDATRTRREAFDYLSNAAGLETYEVVSVKRPGGLRRMLGMGAEADPAGHIAAGGLLAMAPGLAR